MQSGLKTRLDYGDYCSIPTDGKRLRAARGGHSRDACPEPLASTPGPSTPRLLQDYFGSSAELFVSPIDVILSPHDVAQPDVVVVAEPAQVSPRGIEGPPLLVIEVLSPATGAYDRTVKSQRCAALGVDHYWIADPATGRAECHRREGRLYRLVISAGIEHTLTHSDFPGRPQLASLPALSVGASAGLVVEDHDIAVAARRAAGSLRSPIHANDPAQPPRARDGPTVVRSERRGAC
jgi:hypothetical protein